MNYTVRVDTIREIEQELEKWAKKIPLGYRLGMYYQDPAIQRAQFVLALTYSYVQLRLYRPFLHYDIETIEQTKLRLSTGLSPCASACIQACQNIIELCEDMCRWGFLTEASWPAIRILTSCMLTLLYITIMHQDPHEEVVLLKSLATGRKLLNIMEKRSYQARRSKTIFKIIISSLSIKFDHIREKLMRYELEAPNVRQCDLSSVSGASTALLGEKVFTLSSKTYLRSRSLKVHKQDGVKNNAVHLSYPKSPHHERNESTPLQPDLSFGQIGERNMQNFTTPASQTLYASLKTEDSPIQDPSEPSNAPAYFSSSMPKPTPGSSLMSVSTIGAQQEESNGSWMHAFDSMSYTGNIYSPVKDLIGGTSPHIDDINELSDIWDWF
ncbi:hypothetical protein TrVFT333_005897 [Trichoderma virens FT-333]|nr:hypothetical protein TrVFT333_005897 [Trichoderma virens FT-333]